MQYLHNTEVNHRLQSIEERSPRTLKELPWEFAAIGGRLDDAQLRTAETVLGATLRSTVELDRSRTKAKAEDEAEKAKVKVKVKVDKVKAKAKAEVKTAEKAKVKREEVKRVVDDRGPERQVAQHLRRGLDRPPAGDRHPKTQQKCAFYTPKERVGRVTRIVR
jgi:hypothetical protein